jgi:DNA-directed RNA polymerase specialized sigma24 family protein
MMAESMATLDDRRLIEMTIAGQTECFSVLMDRHMSAAKRCISLIVKRTPDIEDILQNTFLKASETYHHSGSRRVFGHGLSA